MNCSEALVHTRTIVLHPRSCLSPRASFRGDAYVLAGNVNSDIRRVVAFCSRA